MAWCGKCKVAKHNYDKCPERFTCPLCLTNDHGPTLHNAAYDKVATTPKEEKQAESFAEIIESLYEPQINPNCCCEKFDRRLCHFCANEQFEKMLERARDGSLFTAREDTSIVKLDFSFTVGPGIRQSKPEKTSRRVISHRSADEEARRHHTDPEIRAARCGIIQRRGWDLARRMEEDPFVLTDRDIAVLVASGINEGEI